MASYVWSRAATEEEPGERYAASTKGRLVEPRDVSERGRKCVILFVVVPPGWLGAEEEEGPWWAR